MFSSQDITAVYFIKVILYVYDCPDTVQKYIDNLLLTDGFT